MGAPTLLFCYVHSYIYSINCRHHHYSGNKSIQMKAKSPKKTIDRMLSNKNNEFGCDGIVNGNYHKHLKQKQMRCAIWFIVYRLKTIYIQNWWWEESTSTWPMGKSEGCGAFVHNDRKRIIAAKMIGSFINIKWTMETHNNCPTIYLVDRHNDDCTHTQARTYTHLEYFAFIRFQFISITLSTLHIVYINFYATYFPAHR